jgi:hypothetical protein
MGGLPSQAAHCVDQNELKYFQLFHGNSESFPKFKYWKTTIRVIQYIIQELTYQPVEQSVN